ncbi:MAG: lipid-A-disaccharide synthase [Bacteroidota bacterium]
MKLYIIAGEDSGDLHAANLIRAIKVRTPRVRTRGVGGDQLAEVGTKLIAHVRDINFMGFWEVIRNLRTIRQLFSQVKEDIKQWQPDAAILVDYPGFNLRMAKFLKRQGIKVIYYISPQVWAWKKNRIKTIDRYVDEMLVILPFEGPFYEAEGLHVTFVGHPLLDVIPPMAPKAAAITGTIALLPGSRKQEIKRMLPIMLALVPRFLEYRFVIAGAPSQTEEFYYPIMGDYPVDLVMNQTHDLLQKADYAIVTSGTATLETALFRVPEVVVYKGSKISYEIGKRLVKIPFISLVNLILGREAVRELIQDDCTPENIEAALRERMIIEQNQVLQTDYQELYEMLGAKGASIRAAEYIIRKIKEGVVY